MVCLNWSEPAPANSNFSGPATACSLAQLLSVTAVVVAATDVPAVTVLSDMAAVLARDDPSHFSAELIVALFLTQ